MSEERKYPTALLELFEQGGLDPTNEATLTAPRAFLASELVKLLASAYQLGHLDGVAESQLTEDQYKKFCQWRKEQDRTVASKQRSNNGPYYGAIGGAYVFSTCSTSLGGVQKVRNDVTGDEIDLTDYSDW